MNHPLAQPAPPKKRLSPLQTDSILESLRSIAGSVGRTVTKDVTGRIAGDALGSLFGNLPKSGELAPNQPLDFQKEHQPAPAQFRRPEVQRPTYVRMEESNLKQQIESVRNELKALSSSLKQLNQEVQKTINEVPVNPGIYHKNFFERLRSMLALIREQIDDSNTWLNLSASRKKQKGYWGMFKKHGTSFGLSNERSIATQAG